MKHITNRMKKRMVLQNDSGFTLIEIILTIILTSILAGIFAEILTSSIQIYTDHNLRKTKHIDFRRTYDKYARDLREGKQWIGTPSSTQILFWKYRRTFPDVSGRRCYSDIRVGFTINADDITYRCDESDWNVQYPLLTVGLEGAGTSFTRVTEGGVDRVVMNIHFTVNDKPMRMRTTVFPRAQGG